MLDSLRIRLGALSNAFTPDQYLEFLNDGVQEVWSVLRSLDLDYFADVSQTTDPTADDFEAVFTTAVREYELPKNCRELRAIEVTTVGFENRVFEYRKFSDSVFQQARREATASGPGSNAFLLNSYYYTVFGTQLILAQYPEVALTARLWYIAAIDDINIDTIPDILFPFNRKIVDFAAERAFLSTQNVEMSQAWMMSWKESVKVLAMTAGSRSSTNAIFITDYEGS